MARIAIDLARRIGTVDPRIFGNFIEHLGRCIYGGVFDEGSPLSDARGFRRDVLDAVRPLRMPVLRWPGGNFVSGYHWLDGVGPAAERPRRTELAWYAEESNRFGTNEFLEYCRVLGTEPYICVNMGVGHDGRGPGLGRVLQRHREHPLGEPPAGPRPSRALPRPLLGARQRDVRQLADRPPQPRGLRQEGPRLRPRHEAYRPRHRARRLRPQRLERLGSDRDRRAGPDHRLVQHPPLHGPGRPLHHRLPVAPGRAGHPHLRGADRASPLHPASHAPHPHRVRRVERLVPDAHRRGPEERHRGALQPERRAGGGHLPPRLHPALPGRPDGQPRPARQRDRPHLHEPHRAVPPDHLSSAPPLRGAHAPPRARRSRRRPDARAAARARGADAWPRPPRRRPRPLPPARRRRHVRRERARAHDRRRQP